MRVEVQCPGCGQRSQISSALLPTYMVCRNCKAAWQAVAPIVPQAAVPVSIPEALEQRRGVSSTRKRAGRGAAGDEVERGRGSDPARSTTGPRPLFVWTRSCSKGS